MNAVTHLEKVIVGEVSAVTHIEKVIAGETSAVTYTEKVITGEAPAVTHLQKVIADEASPVTHLEYVWAGGTPSPTEHEYTGAVPYTFNADGSPLIDYIISGNTIQSGTPTPQNPVMPQGTGERTGNLCDLSQWSNTQTDTKTFFQLSITLYNGTTSLGERRLDVRETGRFALTSATAGDNGATRLTIKHNGSTRDLAIANVYGDFPPNQQLTISFDVSGYDPTVIGGISISNIMLNTGSTAMDFEPYGYKIPISSASTTTPVYLGEVETTRKIKKLVLTGEETISGDIEFHRFYFTIQDMRSEGVRLTKLFCTHYQNISDGRPIANVPNNSIYTGGGTDSQRVFIKTTDYTTVADFKAYLAAQYAAGTPVTIWYVLAEPTTGIVNEPLMKIGDYADSISMEQAGVSIPTANGSTTLDVETTLKPSEVYIKYKGV